MQLDEIQLDKIFGATAGDTDLSCLLFISFTLSLYYHSFYYYYYLFGFHPFHSSKFHPFHSSKCVLSRNPRAHALLVYDQDSLVHLICRARSHIRGRSGPRMYTCCSHQTAWKCKFTSCCCDIAFILQWPSAQEPFFHILVKFTVPFFPNTFLYTLCVLNVTIFCIWIFCLHTGVLCSV